MKRTAVLFAVAGLLVSCAEPQAPGQASDGITTTRIPAGDYPWGIYPGEDAVWVTHRTDGTVGKIDPETNEMTELWQAAPESARTSSLSGVVERGDTLWVADLRRKRIYVLDAQTGEQRGVIRAQGHIYDLFYAARSLWYVDAGASDSSDEELVRLNPRTGRVIARIDMGASNSHAVDLVALRGSIWVLRDQARHVAGTGRNATFRVSSFLWEVDPSNTKVVGSFKLGSGLTRGAVNPIVGEMDRFGGELWFSKVHERRLMELHPENGRVLKYIAIPEVDLVWSFDPAEGYLWVGALNENRIARVDPDTGNYEIFQIDTTTSDVVGAFGSIWIPAPAEPDPWDQPGAVLRIDSR